MSNCRARELIHRGCSVIFKPFFKITFKLRIVLFKKNFKWLIILWTKSPRWKWNWHMSNNIHHKTNKFWFISLWTKRLGKWICYKSSTCNSDPIYRFWSFCELQRLLKMKVLYCDVNQQWPQEQSTFLGCFIKKNWITR